MFKIKKRTLLLFFVLSLFVARVTHGNDPSIITDDADTGEGVENIAEDSQDSLLSSLGKKAKNFGVSAVEALPGGKALTNFFGVGSAKEQTKLLESIDKTEKNTFSQIKAAAKIALNTKNAIESANRKVEESIRLGKRLKKMSFKKMILGQTEDVMGISLNPSRYIPNTKYTRKLKRNMQYSCSREKQTISSVNRVLKNTGKLVGIKAARGTYTSLKKLNKDIEKAIQYDHTVNEYATSRKLILADLYEKQANELLYYEKNGVKISRNEEIQSMLDDEKCNLNPHERLQAYSILHNNIVQSAKLKEKAIKLRQEASQLSEAEKQAIAVEQDRLAWIKMVKYELKERERKGNLRK